MIGDLERNKAEQMIWRGNFTLPHQVNLQITLNGIDDEDWERFNDFMEYLIENQVDPIGAGMPYSQTDIKHKLNREI